MDLKPEEISKIIKAQIKQYDQKLKQDETGTIILVGDGIARASGLESCMANELVEFENGEYGMALNLEEDSVSIVILGSDVGLHEGSIVRRTGRVVSVPVGEELIGRHPFPGPGLAIRILGEITPERVEILQNVDKIYIDALRDAGLYDKVWQAGAILLPVKSVGVMGDERTYESCVALRAVTSTDGMTADWVHLPYEFLARVSNDIINKVRGVNRVVYDISSKPPATIEWE